MEYNKETSLFTGIYQIRNLINNKIYIGSASNKFSLRKNNHWTLLSRNKHWNIHLQNAVNKYKIENFVFEIIEVCHYEICMIREQYYIDTLKPDYNIALFAGKGNKGKPATEKMKKIASKTHKGKIVSEETRKKMSEAAKGRVVSMKTREKQSKRLKGHIFNKGKIHTEEHNSKIGEGVRNFYIKNPTYNIEFLKSIINDRFNNHSLNELSIKYNISMPILEIILYNKKFRIKNNLNEYFINSNSRIVVNHIADERKVKIHEFWNKGKSKTEIAKILGITRQNVYYILKRDKLI